MTTTPLRLLVIDDEKEIVSTVQRFVEYTLGATVDCAHDAPTALKLYREKQPMVILSDIEMPGMTGIELLRDVKRHHPAIQVIIMTGGSSLDRALECLEAGAVDYLMKPLDMEKLEVLVREAGARYQRWYDVIKINLRNGRKK